MTNAWNSPTHFHWAFQIGAYCATLQGVSRTFLWLCPLSLLIIRICKWSHPLQKDQTTPCKAFTDKIALLHLQLPATVATWQITNVTTVTYQIWLTFWNSVQSVIHNLSGCSTDIFWVILESWDELQLLRIVELNSEAACLALHGQVIFTYSYLIRLRIKTAMLSRMTCGPGVLFYVSPCHRHHTTSGQWRFSIVVTQLTCMTTSVEEKRQDWQERAMWAKHPLVSNGDRRGGKVGSGGGRDGPFASVEQRSSGTRSVRIIHKMHRAFNSMDKGHNNGTERFTVGNILKDQKKKQNKTKTVS